MSVSRDMVRMSWFCRVGGGPAEVAHDTHRHAAERSAGSLGPVQRAQNTC